MTKALLSIAFCAVGAFAQSTPPAEFDVASIRPAPDAPPESLIAGVHIDGAQFRANYLSLKDYLGMAYRVKLYQISGPDWLGSTRFDIVATFPAGSESTQLPEMTKKLLEDRFQLKMHHEKKDFPVYALEIAKDGLKIQESPIDPSAAAADPKAGQSFTGGGSRDGISGNLGLGASFTFTSSKFTAKGLTMASVAGIMERFLDRPVVDMTGLPGRYDFSLDVTPEDYRTMLIRSAVVAGVTLQPEVLRLLDNASSPQSVFDSLKKLGIELNSRKAPLDVMVIDSMRKTPTEN